MTDTIFGRHEFGGPDDRIKDLNGFRHLIHGVAYRDGVMV